MAYCQIFEREISKSTLKSRMDSDRKELEPLNVRQRDKANRAIERKHPLREAPMGLVLQIGCGRNQKENSKRNMALLSHNRQPSIDTQVDLHQLQGGLCLTEMYREAAETL